MSGRRQKQCFVYKSIGCLSCLVPLKSMTRCENMEAVGMTLVDTDISYLF